MQTEKIGFRRVIMSCDASRGPLLTRYHLLKTRWVGIYLHHLQASDDDRAVHDHPWSFVTVLLSSGYYEWVSDNGMAPPARRWRHWGSVLYRPAEFAHRLELVRPMWTLVFRFRIRRDWGFFTSAGWMHWRHYSDRFCE